MKFRSRPTVVEAWRWGHCSAPEWLHPNIISDHINGMATTWIETLEGRMAVMPGDWIIKGVKGELYPCKPDIFALRWEAVDDY